MHKMLRVTGDILSNPSFHGADPSGDEPSYGLCNCGHALHLAKDTIYLTSSQALWFDGLSERLMGSVG